MKKIQTKQTRKKRREAPVNGITLNNPLNLHFSEHRLWPGLNPSEPQRQGICHFLSLEDGYRAALMLMHEYMSVYNLLTPAAIIYRWAPATEHKTHLYLAAVCALSGLDQNELIDDMSIEMLQLLVAMARMETGLRPDVTYLMDLCEPIFDND